MRTFAELDQEKQETTTELDRLLEKPRVNPYEPMTHDEAWRLAQIVAASGLYGLAGQPEAAYVILMTGRDLGLSQSQALRGIQNIKGKPAPAAATLVAICLNHPKVCEYFELAEMTEDHVMWKCKRRGRPEQTCSFSMSDANAAGLTRSGGGWTLYPKRMMSARAMAFLARDIFPDITLGLYAAEELLSDAPEVPPDLESVAKWQAPPHQDTDWRQAMLEAPSKAEAIRIGKEATAKDPAIRQAALDTLKERGDRV